MINRFKFTSTRTGQVLHCVVVEQPRRANARAICAIMDGRTMRVPVAMLQHVPEGSPITEERAKELLGGSRKLVADNRAVQRAKRQRNATLNAQLNELLGGVL